MNIIKKQYKKISNIVKSNYGSMSLKKPTFALLAIALLTMAVFAVPAAAETNLVSNPGFESGTTTPLDWGIITKNNIAPIWDTVHHSGTKSIKISVPGTTSIYSGIVVSKFIRVKPGQYYTLSAWIKAQSTGGNSPPFVTIVEADANTKWLRQTTLAFGKGTYDWSQQIKDFQTGADTAILYVIAGISDGYGTFWVDDVSLSLKGATSTSTSTSTPTHTGSGISLPEAVDTTLTITTGGNASWAGQTATSYNGGDAAQSGVITNYGNTWMQTTISGPGTVSFYWKVSSEANYDFLEFYIDGAKQTQISGTVDWQQKSYVLTAGQHTLQWKYIKDRATIKGSDAGWIDRIEFVSGKAPLPQTQPTPTPAPTPAVSGPSLPEAVDTTLTITTGGNASWAGQTATSYNGGDAAQSGIITNYGNTWMQTSISGPGTVSFYWKVSSEANYDFLEFYIDGAKQTQISGTVDWQQKSYVLTAGQHTLQWKYIKDRATIEGSDAGWIDRIEFVSGTAPLPQTQPTPAHAPTPPVSGLSLPEAVDNTTFTITTGGNASWAGQTATSYNGGDAAQSGVITNYGNTWMQTSISGPGTVSFYWKVSSEANYDFLEFYLDGTEQTQISGTVDWQKKSYVLTAGQHTLQWKYIKDRATIEGSDTAWVDKVEFVPGTAPLPAPAPTPTSGKTYYVAKNGNDNNLGTDLSPFLTIQKAVNMAKAGDTVYVKAGTYTEQVTFPNSGTSYSNMITLQNYSTDIVIITPPIASYSGITGTIDISGKSYIKVKGMKIRSPNEQSPWSQVSIRSGAHHIIIDHNTLEQMHNNAVTVGFSGSTYAGFKAAYIDFTYNTVDRSVLPGHTHATMINNELTSWDGVGYVNFSYNTILGQANGGGNHFKDGSAYFTISYNTISDIYDAYRPDIGYRAQAIYMGGWEFGSHDYEVFGNILTNTNAIDVGCELACTVYNVNIYNNIAKNGWYGVYLYPYATCTDNEILPPGWDCSLDTTPEFDNVKIYNNVFYNNGGKSVWANSPDQTNVVIRNNIVYGTGTTSIGYGAVQDHNSWNLGITNPLFVDSANHNFRLQSTSPAIDKGSSEGAPVIDKDGNSRPQGGGYDLGAFEQ